MLWKLNSEFCTEAVMFAARVLHRNNGVYKISHKQTADGKWQVTAKVKDSFNYVSHPQLTVDHFGDLVTKWSCDCDESGDEGHPCAHVVALAIALVQQNAGHLFWSDSQKLAPMRPEPIPTPLSPQPEDNHIQKPLPAQPEAVEPEELPEELREKSVAGPPRSMKILLGKRKDSIQEVFSEDAAPESEDGQQLFWLPNDTEQVFHTNTGIIGTMGTGKTQFTKSLVTQLYHQTHDNYDGSPFGILIFDYKGDYNETKTDFIKATNAKVMKPHSLQFNPLALNCGRSFKPLLPLHTANEFKDTIAKIYRLGPKQQEVLRNAILKAYVTQRIDKDRPETWAEPAPTIDQVCKIFARESVGRPVDSLTAAMNKLNDFCLFEKDPKKAVSLRDLLKGVVVIDLSGYDSDIQSLIVAITLNQFYAQMQTHGSSDTDGRFRKLRTLILVDEADFFMGQDFPSLRKIMKEGREFGVGVLLSTQSLSHFVGGKDDYSRYILTWCVHNVSDLKEKDVEYVFRLQPKSPENQWCYAQIKGLGKHESVVKIGNESPQTIRDKAFWELYKERYEQ